MSNYWQDRIANNQLKIEAKTIKQINRQLQNYYSRAANQIIRDFESVYNKLLAQQEEGKEPTPADLYKLDKYWQAQAQMRQQLQKLGEKTISTLTKAFEVNYFDVYYGIALPGEAAFNTVDKEVVNQLINGTGKMW